MVKIIDTTDSRRLSLHFYTDRLLVQPTRVISLSDSTSSSSRRSADSHLLCLSSGLHPSEEHLKANYVTTPREGCPSLKLLQMLLLLPVFGGCTATILRGLTYPKILCAPEKEERKRENGDITWRRSSLSRAWAAEMVT